MTQYICISGDMRVVPAALWQVMLDELELRALERDEALDRVAELEQTPKKPTFIEWALENSFAVPAVGQPTTKQTAWDHMQACPEARYFFCLSGNPPHTVRAGKHPATGRPCLHTDRPGHICFSDSRNGGSSSWSIHRLPNAVPDAVPAPEVTNDPDKMLAHLYAGGVLEPAESYRYPRKIREPGGATYFYADGAWNCGTLSPEQAVARVGNTCTLRPAGWQP